MPWAYAAGSPLAKRPEALLEEAQPFSTPAPLQVLNYIPVAAMTYLVRVPCFKCYMVP